MKRILPRLLMITFVVGALLPSAEGQSRPDFLKKIRWERDLAKAMERAREKRKPVLIYVTDTNGIDGPKHRPRAKGAKAYAESALEAGFLASDEWKDLSKQVVPVLRMVRKELEYSLDSPMVIALDSRGRDLFSAIGVGEIGFRAAVDDAVRMVELHPGPYAARPDSESPEGAELELLEIIRGVRTVPLSVIRDLVGRCERLRERARERSLELIMLEQIAQTRVRASSNDWGVRAAISEEGMLSRALTKPDPLAQVEYQKRLYDYLKRGWTYRVGADSVPKSRAERLYTRFWAACAREAIRNRNPELTRAALDALRGHELQYMVKVAHYEQAAFDFTARQKLIVYVIRSVRTTSKNPAALPEALRAHFRPAELKGRAFAVSEQEVVLEGREPRGLDSPPGITDATIAMALETGGRRPRRVYRLSYKKAGETRAQHPQLPELPAKQFWHATAQEKYWVLVMEATE